MDRIYFKFWHEGEPHEFSVACSFEGMNEQLRGYYRSDNIGTKIVIQTITENEYSKLMMSK